MLLQVLPHLQLATSWTPSFSPPQSVPFSQPVFIQATHLHYRNLFILNCIHTEKAQMYTSMKHWLLRQKGWDPAALGSSCQQLNQKQSRPRSWNSTGTPLLTTPSASSKGQLSGASDLQDFWLEQSQHSEGLFCAGNLFGCRNEEDKSSKGSGTWLLIVSIEAWELRWFFLIERD